MYDGRKAEEDVSATVDECILKLDELNKKLEEAREAISAYKKCSAASSAAPTIRTTPFTARNAAPSWPNETGAIAQ